MEFFMKFLEIIFVFSENGIFSDWRSKANNECHSRQSGQHR